MSLSINSSHKLGLGNYIKQTEGNEFDPTDIVDARKKVAQQINARRGQKKFRKELLEIFGGRCLITSCDAVDVLEACHIVQYKGDKTNNPANGLLLRSDIHTLFDLGLLLIDSHTSKVRLSSKLLNTQYVQYDGRKVELPSVISTAALDMRELV